MREIFDYTPLPDGTAALARVYGDSPVLALPEALPGPGGLLPLTKLGGYCFAETVRDAPRGALLRCVREEDGVLRTVLPGSVPEEGLTLRRDGSWKRSPCRGRCGRWAAAPFTTAAPCAG